MSENSITQPDDTNQEGKKLRVVRQTVGGVQVYDLVIEIADPTTPTNKLAIDSQGRITLAGTVEAGSDVTDRAGRLVGIVYGNLDQLQQKATTKELKIALEVDDVGLAKESGGNVASIKSDLDTLIAKDFATQTTLALIKAKTDNLDTALSGLKTDLDTLPSNNRYGRNVTPAWTLGSEATAPAADTALVTKGISSGKTGYIYGFMISAQEPNDFKIKWTSGTNAKTYRLVFAGAGSMIVLLDTALNEGLGADASSNITINNVNAGTTGKIYQAQLLTGEV